MGKLNEIKAPIAEHLKVFEGTFRKSMDSNIPLMNTILKYILRSKGKQMRPMFVFLSGQITGGVTESVYRGAALIELLHTATLVHDDVVDDSNKRRGFFSINALWKNKIAVLLGDFLLSKGLLLALDNNEFDLLKIVSNATKEMAEGELLQIEKARKLDIEEEIYFEIIRKKTASLIASCCASGAHGSGADKETVDKMHKFGELTGIAFQIKDDLFDYQKTQKTGKPSGIDIKEQKMTLPLIYVLSKSDRSQKKKIINTIKRHNKDNKKVEALMKHVIDNGGIEYAKEKMYQYREEALTILNEFPQSSARESMRELVIYTTEREK
jgi:octaprenyl-diphosphate synthase